MISDSAIVAICTAAPLLIAQIVNLVIAIRNHTKIAEVAIKVDGTASASQQREESLHKEVESLTSILAEKKETAALLAQAAVRPPTPPPQ